MVWPYTHIKERRFMNDGYPSLAHMVVIDFISV